VIFIYCITNSSNGKRYVGQTSHSLQTRLGNHFRAARAHRMYRLQQAIRKWGEENFSISLIRITLTQAEANDAEKHYIAVYRSFEHAFGYNMTEGGFAMSEKARESRRARWLGDSNPSRCLETRSRGMLGRRHSDSSKRQISEAHRGRRLTSAQREHLRVVNTGRKCDWADKISAALKGRKFTVAHRNKLSMAARSRKPSTEKIGR
jgi:group I intron endonuclease